VTTLATQLPTRRADLVIGPIGHGGRYVVKDPDHRNYFEIGQEEHFLLTQLDGEQDAEAVCAAFEAQFGEPLSEEDLDGFIEMAREQGLLDNADRGTRDAESIRDDADSQPTSRNPKSKQSILYWRKSLFDPDRFFTWLEPKIRFFWTRGFLVVSAGCIVLATMVMWTGRHEVVGSFAHALRWETMLFAWLTMLAVGTLHESAHGLTCKHYGGEVREIGFLLMYFMPCFYCNVSDAWLFREKSKRLWVTFAGGYFELFVWALAVFVWRITMPDTLINYLAFIVLAVSGVDSFFNFNPLIKLDGYYLLSDGMEIPNLRQRSFDYTMSRGRWILWGGPRPEPQPRGRFLLGFGLVSWLYSLTIIVVMLAIMYGWLGDRLGFFGLSVVAFLGLISLRGLVGNLFREEFMTMIWQRHRRKLVWASLLGGIGVASCLIPWTEHAAGQFEVRAKTHAELRAPVAGFLDDVYYDEGQKVSPDGLVAKLRVPDLDSRIAQKEAELREAQARLRLLRAGPREEEIAQQRRRVEAAKAWRDVAARDVERQKQALEQELVRFDKVLEGCRAECDYAKQAMERIEALQESHAVSEEEHLSARRTYLVACAKCEQTEAEERARAARGTMAAESELAEREKELTHEQATLALLEAGSRPEEIEAAEATVARLREEASYLNELTSRLAIHSPVAGSITTCRLKEKIGDYFEEGGLICDVEDAQTLEVVIAVDEDQAARVRPGQKVRLKARSLPFDVFEVQVERIAPRATQGEVQSAVNVYCRLDDPDRRLRSGMTGYARIRCGRNAIGSVFVTNCARLIRTEFWW
jgi:multidrug efflux pump subunit AcrA (membrane-fusion protein)